MAANNKNNYKKNSEVTMFRGVRLLVEVSRAEGRFFYVEARIHIFMFIKKIFEFYKRARSARQGCIDALPLI